MDTRKREVPYFKADGKTRILLERFELGMCEKQVQRILTLWEEGNQVEEISKKEKRHVVEVIALLIEEAYEGNITRAFAYRRPKKAV